MGRLQSQVRLVVRRLVGAVEAITRDGLFNKMMVMTRLAGMQ